MPQFLTIREVARMGVLNENLLRSRLKQGKLPGIYAQSRFLVNLPALVEMLETESRALVVGVNDAH